MSPMTHVTVCEQQLCCMHAVQASFENEMPDAFRSHAPPDAGVDGPPLEPLEPLEPVVSGSGPVPDDEAACFDEHAIESADARSPTPNDT